jgi:hypothetical protein
MAMRYGQHYQHATLIQQLLHAANTQVLSRFCYHPCRHGARTPLSDSTYLWGDTVWNVAGQPFEVGGRLVLSLLLCWW